MINSRNAQECVLEDIASAITDARSGARISSTGSANDLWSSQAKGSWDNNFVSSSKWRRNFGQDKGQSGWMGDQFLIARPSNSYVMPMFL